MTPKLAYNILRSEGWNHYGALEIINLLELTDDGLLYDIMYDDLIKLSNDYKDR